MLASLLLLSCACNTTDADATDGATDAKETEKPTERPTEKPTEKPTEPDTDEPTDTTEADTPGEVMTLPPETVPEPETDAKPMPRLDIYTDDGGDVTSKDVYKHGTATLSNCHEKFAFENVGVNIRARGNSTFGKGRNCGIAIISLAIFPAPLI